MRRRGGVSTLLLLLSVAVADASAQQPRTGSVLDHTLVPDGRLRVQVGAVASRWDTRFGRLLDGSEPLEKLGEDLTDPTTLSLYPGMPTLASSVRDLTGVSDYSPILGSTDGRINQEITSVEFALDVGVFDWLTVGATLPWVQTRTVIDSYFSPDTISGNLGLNPTITDPQSVGLFLGTMSTAETEAATRAATICAGGPSPACSDAQSLANRTSAFFTTIESAYAATPFFPSFDDDTGGALRDEAAALSTELAMAGLGSLSTLPLATDLLTSESFPLLPAVVGSGIEAAALTSRAGLYGAGDLELSARVRLLDNLTPTWSDERTFPADRAEARADEPWLGYSLSTSFLTRLPTGSNEDPDILLDVGRSDAQLDFEAGATATLRFGGLFGLTAGGRYGTQGSTTLTKRVAPPELVMAPLGTRTQVVFDPGSYLVFGAAPVLHVTDGLSLHGEYRFYRKGRDRFELVTPNAGLDPTVLEIESEVEMHQAGAGIRYDSTAPWRAGADGFPMEIHLRFLSTFAGSGGQAPQTTRVEAGLRLFRRFWGPDR